MAAQTLQERIKRNVVVDSNGCWLWQCHKIKNGYGQISVNQITKMAHRISYEVFIGEIPNGFHVDHLCRVRDCVNPKHLEAVTAQENVHRSNAKYKQQVARTHCPKEHEYTRDNIFYGKTKFGGLSRSCKQCDYARHKISREKKEISI